MVLFTKRNIIADRGSNDYGRQQAYEDINECIKAIEEQSTADVRENVKGEWIVEEMHEAKYGKVSFRCSACGIPFELEHRLGASVGWNFCPLCGADMRGEA